MTKKASLLLCSFIRSTNCLIVHDCAEWECEHRDSAIYVVSYTYKINHSFTVF